MFTDKRILIVDDSPVARRFLCKLLVEQGAKVDEASNGREGLALNSAEGRYDLILLDLLMPDIDGIEVLQRIREVDDTSAIVMVTGAGGVKSAIAAVRRGADGYVEKRDISVGGDTTGFLYALERAIERRAGVIAQKQLQEIRADFYSMVTHDLRSPTSSVSIAINMLLDGDVGPITADQHELLVIAQESTEKLLNLINDYLDFARINAGYLRPDLRETELRGLVEISAHLARLQARPRRQTLTLDLPAEPVHGCVDAERFKQVLDNLLSNAIKYTPEGGEISVQLRVEGKEAVFQVRDTGMGIPPEQLPALFAKYHRLPGKAAARIPGAGLGLLIVKEIVQAHGGAVHAESGGVPGKGTTFIVRIPLDQPGQDGRQ